MPVQVEQLIASLALVEAQTAEAPHPFILILRDPENGEEGFPVDGLISVVVVSLNEDPSTTAPYNINCVIEISLDDGDTWLPAYNAGSFSSPFDGGSSAVVQHSPTDPFVYNQVTIDYTGTYVDSSEIIVRLAASGSGWGFGPWAHFPWGHPFGSDVLLEEWSFTVEDLTAPRLLSAEAIDQYTVRLTYDDDMRAGTPDGRARLLSGTSETWNLSSGGETLTVVVDGGETQEVVFQTYMWLTPSAVTADELATALTALISGAVAENDGAGAVYLYSETAGDTSTLRVSGGTANGLIQFPTDTVTGQSEGILDAENYTIDRHNVYPEVAVHLTVETAAFVEDSLRQVDLTVQWEMTPRAPYSVTVDGDVADTSNNVIDPDYVTAEFTGFEPEWPADRDTEITLPQAAWDGDPFHVTRATVNMMQEAEDLKVTDVDKMWDAWNIDTCNDYTVELMLYDVGNPFTDIDLTAEQKRKLVDLLPYIYEQKGLLPGVVSTILALLEIPVTLVPYTQDSWRLGHGRLGSQYPARLWSSNAETYNLAGGGTLLISIDGETAQTVTFEDADFLSPAAATAEEVAIVINAQLTGGGANIFDDGGGIRVEVFTTTWGPDSSIQVTGGTFAVIIGFDTAIRSGGGSCMLGPSSERLMRTFDLEYSTVIPSELEIKQMTKIANYIKPVNTHLGRIRAAKTIPVPEYWMLGFDFLGEDTVLGG